MAKRTTSRSTVSAPPKTPAAMERRWRAQDALSTLMRAAEIKKDPQLVRDAQKIAREQQAALSRVTAKK